MQYLRTTAPRGTRGLAKPRIPVDESGEHASVEGQADPPVRLPHRGATGSARLLCDALEAAAKK